MDEGTDERMDGHGENQRKRGMPALSSVRPTGWMLWFRKRTLYWQEGWTSWLICVFNQLWTKKLRGLEGRDLLRSCCSYVSELCEKISFCFFEHKSVLLSSLCSHLVFIMFFISQLMFTAPIGSEVVKMRVYGFLIEGGREMRGVWKTL